MTAVFSLGVSHHLFKITLCEHIDSMSSKLQENNETNKNLLHKLLCFQMPNTCKRIQASITSFSKTTLLQREQFLTRMYTINSSLLFVTKKVFMLTIVLSPIVSSAFKVIHLALCWEQERNQGSYTLKVFYRIG